VEAIGTHGQIAVLGAPVGQVDRHAPGVLGDPDALRPQPQDAAVQRGQQDRLQQAAVHHDRWRLQPGHGLLRQVHPQWRASCAAQRPMGRDRARLLDGRPDLQPPQHPHRVRPQQDAGADLAQLGGLLEDHDPQAAPAQGDRRAQPTDPGADDDDLPRPDQGLTFLNGSLTCPPDATRRRGASDRQVHRSCDARTNRSPVQTWVPKTTSLPIPAPTDRGGRRPGPLRWTRRGSRLLCNPQVELVPCRRRPIGPVLTETSKTVEGGTSS
jgi:hypothetical protein